MLYKFLDYFFTVFHSAIILFNLFGWIFKKTRKGHLIIAGITAIFWFGLGIFYGIGYCPLTDWHFRVLEKSGYTDLPASYIQFLIERIFQAKVKSATVDLFTVIIFCLILITTIILNIRDFIKKSGNK